MNAFPLPAITALYAGLIGILLLVTAARISRLRGSLKIGVGDGGNPELLRAIRVHGNLVEWALPVLLLLLIAELNRAPALFLHACGAALVVGRILHAVGFSRSPGESVGRFAGTLATWLVLLVLSVWAIWTALR
jgi:uncharacterized membrane protein YecN with MAPEG domain